MPYFICICFCWKRKYLLFWLISSVFLCKGNDICINTKLCMRFFWVNPNNTDVFLFCWIDKRAEVELQYRLSCHYGFALLASYCRTYLPVLLVNYNLYCLYKRLGRRGCATSSYFIILRFRLSTYFIIGCSLLFVIVIFGLLVTAVGPCRLFSLHWKYTQRVFD